MTTRQFKQLAKRMLANGGYTRDKGVYAAHTRFLAKGLQIKLGEPILPRRNESLAMTIMAPKTAALAFDKVYRTPILEDPVPSEIGFYCATPTEIAAWASVMEFAERHYRGRESPSDQQEDTNNNEPSLLRLLCRAIHSGGHLYPTIVYPLSEIASEDFPAGHSEILTASIEDLAIVDEDKLSWDQVLEFRKDKQAQIKYRRMVRWTDEELKSGSPKEVVDLIAIRIDDYEWAVRKHGLKAGMGTISSLLDPKFLGASSAAIGASAIAGGGFWGALAAATLAVGKASISFGTELVEGIDERRRQNYEVAYVHEIKRRLTTKR
jgi:hypothetical protein